MSSQISVEHTSSSNRINTLFNVDKGLLKLQEYVVFNALHDSPKRMPHPTVHPKTRKTILDVMMNWIKNPDPEHDVLWLRAPFGHGKTAVMQKIAELLQSSSATDYAGSYFFGHEETALGEALHLIPTIVYQIAHNIPVMRAHVNHLMTRDPTLPLKNMETQLQRLVLDPFHRCSTPFPNKPVVIIDGLDGCTDRLEDSFNDNAKRFANIDAQSSILDLVAKAVLSPHCPLRFIIASRPESHIKDAFLQQPLCHVSRQIELDGDGDQGVNSFANRNEMMEFLRDGFNEICVRFADVMSTIERPWPSNNDLWELVRKASGQYLFANSVLQFVGSGPESPAKRLKIILKQQHRGKRKAFATMDHGYIQILTVCPGRRKYSRRALRICAYLHGWEEAMTLSTLAEILGCEIEDVVMPLPALHALLDIDEYYDIPADIPWPIYLRHYSPSVRIRHISLIEFLLDRKRSGKFRLDRDAMQEWLMDRADKLLADGLYGRAQSLLHPTTLKLIGLLAAVDTLSDDDNEDKNGGIEHSPHFPCLREFLKMITEIPFSVPDEPGKRFVDSIYTVLSVFDMIGHKEAFKNYIAICYDLLDQAWRKTTSFSPRFDTIVYSIMTHNLSSDISTISKALGTPLHETFDILDQYSCFTILGQRVELLDHFRSFAETESRSGPFHYHYRECWIRAILSCWRELLKEVPMFTLESHSHRQLIEGFYNQATISDINFGSDLQENSAMNDLIDFVHMIASSGESVVGQNVYGADIMALFIRWLVRQQKMLRLAHEKNTNMATKLQDIVKNVDWSRLANEVFSIFLQLTPAGALVLPLGIERLHHHHARTRRAVQIYPYILQLAQSNTVPALKENMISGISHTMISEFFLHALLAREHRKIGIDEWKTFYVPILIKDVQWHYHLSHAMFTEKILLAILSVHYIYSQREDPTVSDQERMALDTMKQLSRTSFADGVTAWLTKHTREGTLEWWRKGIPGMEQRKNGGNFDSAPKPGISRSSIPDASARLKRRNPTSNTATNQVNRLPSTSTTTAGAANSEPVSKRLRSVRKQGSRPT